MKICINKEWLETKVDPNKFGKKQVDFRVQKAFIEKEHSHMYVMCENEVIVFPKNVLVKVVDEGSFEDTLYTDNPKWCELHETEYGSFLNKVECLEILRGREISLEFDEESRYKPKSPFYCGIVESTDSIELTPYTIHWDSFRTVTARMNLDGSVSIVVDNDCDYQDNYFGILNKLLSCPVVMVDFKNEIIPKLDELLKEHPMVVVLNSCCFYYKDIFGNQSYDNEDLK